MDDVIGEVHITRYPQGYISGPELQIGLYLSYRFSAPHERLQRSSSASPARTDEELVSPSRHIGKSRFIN